MIGPKQLISFFCIIFTVGMLLHIGCSDQNSTRSKKAETPKYDHYIEVIRVDGCEYIIMKGYPHNDGIIKTTKAGGITHKANCDNPEHNKE